MKITSFILLVFFSFASVSCDKKNKEIKELDNLSNTSWIAIMTDGNLESNPPGIFGMGGNNQYFPWLSCHLDDSFNFTAKQLIIDHNGTNCGVGTSSVFQTSNQSYSYDPGKKLLYLETPEGVTLLQVYEMNQFRLKVGFHLPNGGNIVFLFKRK